MNRAFVLLSSVFALLAISALPAVADSTYTMSFHGAADGRLVANFYNGRVGPDYGVSFSSDLISVKSMYKGGSGSVASWPSSNPIFNTAIFSQGNGANGMSAALATMTFSGPANEARISETALEGNTRAIPEPSSMYLLGAGVGAIILGRCRKFFVH
jgi:hypothetical protein